jgi:DNA polymerase-1
MRLDKKQPTVKMCFDMDLENALIKLEHDFPKFDDDKKKVKILTNHIDVNIWLDLILETEPEMLAMDYETTGLKLHKKGHAIKTCSFAWIERYTNNEICIAFKLSKEVIPKLLLVLKSRKIRKSIQNMSFEESCSRVFLKQKITSIEHDTMIATHVIDNRSKITGLKFQAFVRFGVVDYSSSVEEYITSGDSKNGNAFNRIDEAPINDLLMYNGLDSLYELRLYYLQKKIMKRDRPGYGYALLHEGMKALIDVEENGMRIDKEYCEKQLKHADRRIKYMKKQIMEDETVKKWKKREGAKFKLSSHDQLKYVLFKDLKLEPTVFTDKVDRKTGKPNPKTDKEVLDSFSDQVPFIKKLLDIKKLTTARDTYLKGWLREEVDGIIHTMFSLSVARSWRSSSSKPNLQNVPIRDKEMQKMLRMAIIAMFGYQLLEADFKAVEVATAACVTQDPMLIKECKDPNADMHRDMAMELFLLTKDEVHKDIRHLSKNGFVFPSFYGDYYGQTAPRMWDTMIKNKLILPNNQVLLYDHLKEQGIKKYEDFEEHVKKVENNFWDKRFQVYNTWKYNAFDDYMRKGYLETVTGFKCSGPLEKKQICNYPIQGPAFHCLLWTLIQANKIMKEEKLKSKIILQIHDSTITNLFPPEKNRIIDMYTDIVDNRLRKQYPWIIVPMKIEMEITGINESWYHKKPLEV